MSHVPAAITLPPVSASRRRTGPTRRKPLLIPGRTCNFQDGSDNQGAAGRYPGDAELVWRDFLDDLAVVRHAIVQPSRDRMLRREAVVNRLDAKPGGVGEDRRDKVAGLDGESAESSAVNVDDRLVGVGAIESLGRDDVHVDAAQFADLHTGGILFECSPTSRGFVLFDPSLQRYPLVEIPRRRRNRRGVADAVLSLLADGCWNGPSSRRDVLCHERGCGA